MEDDTISTSSSSTTTTAAAINQMTGASSSSSSSSSSEWKHDVFLSFGKDTRKNFTGHLYNRLKNVGIITFRDENLKRGEGIAPGLFEAIRASRCSIIVFSKQYSLSSWCLDELIEILKQKEERKQKVFPVFYNVDPSHLRRQAESDGEAFVKDETIFDQDKMQRWRKALSDAANLSGWHLQDRYESVVIDEIVREIFGELSRTWSSFPNNLIGIKSRSDDMLSKLCLSEDNVRIVGICGMGGIGKTTLAGYLCTTLSHHFEGTCLLPSVREASKMSELVSLQRKLLSEIFPTETFQFSNIYDGSKKIHQWLRGKRVLLVIDDVDDHKQLDCLAKERGWFGLGSKIIITTRNEQLLQGYRVDGVYKLKKLNDSESLQLLSLNAFNSYTPKNEFTELSKKIVEYADGLPLALELLGRRLCNQDAAQWDKAIQKFKCDLIEKIHDTLRVSFDGLEEIEKNIFLDIAHKFFEGKDKDFATKILDGCEYHAGYGIDELIKRSLITVKHNKILMHNLLQEMGRKIVRHKSLKEPGKRCRLMEERVVFQVLTENLATEAIEGIHINKSTREQNEPFTAIAYAFSKMTKLRLLKVRGLSQSFNLSDLSKELRLFDWPGCPLKSLPLSFQSNNLVALLLPNNCIERIWGEYILLKNLKIVDLKRSRNLIRTPDFRNATNLESLNLEGCTSLTDVDSSIAFLPNLKLLNLRNCRSLKSLATEIGMKSLNTLILSGCTNLQRFPEIAQKMECLLKLCLDGTGITELPCSFGSLTSLVFLNLKNCRNLMSLPNGINGSKSLQKLYLSGCSKLEVENLPENLQHLHSL